MPASERSERVMQAGGNSRFAAAGDTISLVDRPIPKPRLAPAPWLFAAAMAIALGIAATAGIGLGLAAVLETWIAETKWTATVQAHGRVQMFAFAAVFICALTFEFIVRLNQRPAMALRPRVAVLSLLGIGSLAAALLQIQGGTGGPLLVAANGLLLAGAVGFLVLIWRVPPVRPWRDEVLAFYFRAAASWLVAGAALAVVAAVRSTDGISLLEDARASGEILASGFVLNTVFAVALRALPGHLDVLPMPWRKQALAFAGLNVSLAGWLLASGAAGLPENETAMRLFDIGIGVSVLAFSWWTGLVASIRFRRVGLTRYKVLVPLAWLGLVVYGATLVAFAIVGGAEDYTLYQEGTVRHMLLLGFMAPLMVAFAHIVLARFGNGSISKQNALTAGFVLLMLAWPLRVAPALFVDAPGDTGRMLMGTGGVLAAGGLALAAMACGSTAAQLRRATS